MLCLRSQSAAGWGALTYPMTISGAGILVCLLTNYFATDWFPVKAEKDIETVLQTQLAVVRPDDAGGLLPLLPSCPPQLAAVRWQHIIGGVCSSPEAARASRWACGAAVSASSEHTSLNQAVSEGGKCMPHRCRHQHHLRPRSHKSAIVPVFAHAGILFDPFAPILSAPAPAPASSHPLHLHRRPGVHPCSDRLLRAHDRGLLRHRALRSACSMSTCLAIDVYGPVCDNAGGIAEMYSFTHRYAATIGATRRPDITTTNTTLILPPTPSLTLTPSPLLCSYPRESPFHPSPTRTSVLRRMQVRADALGAAGNTTPYRKSFAIGSACLVGLALFGAFVTRLNDAGAHMAVDLLARSRSPGCWWAQCCRTGSRR